MRPRRRGVTGLATAAALVLGACSGTPSTAPSAPTRSDGTSATAGPGPTRPPPRAPTADPTSTPTGGPTSAPTSAPAAGPTSEGAQDGGLGAPDEALLAQAREDVSELGDRELAGQLVVAAYSGTDAGAAADLVAQHHLAGVITLGGNVPEDPEQRVGALGELTSAVQGAVAADGRDWPAFLAIDQEGGPITRVGLPLDPWPAPMALGAADDPGLSTRVAQGSGRQLRALGYTVVLAPVADVTAGPQDPTIGSRSPGSDPAVVARTAVAQSRGYAQAGLVPVAKHFPGHGSVTADSHVGRVEQDAPLAELEKRDLVPFRALVAAGVPALMPGHIVVRAVDPDRPATLSAPVLTGLLREDLGFTGLVVTDALNMGAVSGLSGTDDLAVESLQAGADVLLMPTDPAAAVDGILAGLEDGRLDRSRLEESAALTVATLRQADRVERPGPDAVGAAANLAQEAAAAGITQLSGPCGDPLVGESIEVLGGTPASRQRLLDAAARAGLGTGGGTTVLLLGAPDYAAGGGGGGGGGPPSGSADVVVATDVPYGLADSSAGTALLAAYGSDRATAAALVDVLTGERTAAGTLPVAVGELPVGAGCAADR